MIWAYSLLAGSWITILGVCLHEIKRKIWLAGFLLTNGLLALTAWIQYEFFPETR